MPITPTYPGVYIEEVPSPVRSIPGVSTSVTAFIGFTGSGPVDEPQKCFDFGDFERTFGGLHAQSEMSYAVQQFFLNGGKEAWIVRVALNHMTAKLKLRDEAGDPRLQLEARSAGGWGNFVRVQVDYRTANPDATFNLTVAEYVKRGVDYVPGRVETYGNLSMNRYSPRYAPDVVSKQSDLMTISRIDAPAIAGPAWSRSANIFGNPAVPAKWVSDDRKFIGIRVHGQGPFDVPLWTGATAPTTLWKLKTSLQTALNTSGIPLLQGITVSVLKADGAVAADEAASDASGAFLQLAATHPGDVERSSVQVMPATGRDASKVLRLGIANGGREREAAAAMRPAANGSMTRDLSTIPAASIDQTQTIRVTYRDEPTVDTATFILGPAADGAIDSPQALANRIKARLDTIGDSKPLFKGALVDVVGTRVRIRPGKGSVNARFVFVNDAAVVPNPDVVNVLGLLASTGTNALEYSLGIGGQGLQLDAVGGLDGDAPTLAEHKGSEGGKTGIYALEKIDLFNILCIPFFNTLDADGHGALFAAAIEYCERRRAFLVVDPPMGLDSPAEVQAWVSTATKHKNAAVYWPELHVADPLADYRTRVTPPSGTIAGLYARTDANRGVWKAPAGTEAVLNNVAGLDHILTDMENGQINPLGVNAIRQFPVFGRISWGARTLMGADAQASEWKYVPIRRLALYIEESLYRGTQWVVFEPNDEPLWSQIRLNVGAFMHNLYRQGAFQGASPKDAYFVKCDRSTNPQDEIDRGIVNILIGFAPLKPAEFVFLKISQIAPQAP